MITEVHDFINLAFHYQKFIPRFSEIAIFITNLMKGSSAKEIAISQGKKEEAAFKELKAMLTSKLILRHLQIDKSFIIDPDSSQFIIDTILQQYFPDSKTGKNRFHFIAYESKKLMKIESRYPA